MTTYNYQKNFENLKRTREEDEIEYNPKRYKEYHKMIQEEELELDEDFLVKTFNDTVKVSEESKEENIEEDKYDKYKEIIEEMIQTLILSEKNEKEFEEEIEKSIDEIYIEEHQRDIITQIELINLENI